MKVLKFIIILNIIIAFIFFFYITCFAENTAYVWSNNANVVNDNTIETSSTTKEDNNLLKLESTSAILIEQTTRSSFICT